MFHTWNPLTLDGGQLPGRLRLGALDPGAPPYPPPTPIPSSVSFVFLTLTTSLMLSAVTFCTSCISLATLRHSAEIRGASSSVNQCRTWSYFFSCVSVTILELKKKRGRKNELSRRRLEKGEGAHSTPWELWDMKNLATPCDASR